VYCCFGCFLVSRIVGRQGDDGGKGGKGSRTGEGVHAWNILRLGVGALLAMNVMMLSILLYTGALESQSVPVFRWMLLGLSAPAMALLGYPFILGAAGEIARRRLSLDTLIAVGSFAAFLTSAVNTFRGSGSVYYDTATMLPALVTFGKIVEATAKGRTGRLVHELETLLPACALRIDADGPREVPLAELRPGDRLRVRPGERFPADGRIVEGRTAVEEAAFTGEWRPRECGPGDAVLAGTVNGEGGVVIAAERVGEAVLLQRIIEMVDEARRRPARFERLAERAASAFIPFVLVLAAGAGAGWLLAGGGSAKAGMAALAVLVVACPCALGIAAPLVAAMAIGLAARRGVLVRGGDVLERTAELRTIFFDKTGTLTTGEPSVRRVETFDAALGEEELLGWVASLESGSEHSLARAVVGEAKARGIALGAVEALQAIPGQGVRGRVSLSGRSREVLAGTGAFVGDGRGVRGRVSLGGQSREILAGTGDFVGGGQAVQAADGSATEIVVAWEGRPRGRVLLDDTARPEAAEAVARLHKAGVDTVLLSGDRPEAARALAREIGIERVEAPCRPEEKTAAVQAAADREIVGMVGDGINDAPALAAAHVGFALGAGTDLARQAGHVVLLSDRLTQSPWLVDLARRTRRIIMQNLAWAFGYNAIALALAAAGWLHPLLAAVAMVASSLTLLGNSLRLRRP
jgi:heavy metal translocating P-type ATPase